VTRKQLTDEETRELYEAFLKWLEPFLKWMTSVNEAFEKWLMDLMEIYDKYIKEKEARLT